MKLKRYRENNALYGSVESRKNNILGNMTRLDGDSQASLELAERLVMPKTGVRSSVRNMVSDASKTNREKLTKSTILGSRQAASYFKPYKITDKTEKDSAKLDFFSKYTDQHLPMISPRKIDSNVCNS